jgi:hypothetical protein
MKRARSQIDGERRLGFAQDHGDALLAECERAHQPGRTGARDDNRVAPAHLTKVWPVSFSKFL